MRDSTTKTDKDQTKPVCTKADSTADADVSLTCSLIIILKITPRGRDLTY